MLKCFKVSNINKAEIRAIYLKLNKSYRRDILFSFYKCSCVLLLATLKQRLHLVILKHTAVEIKKIIIMNLVNFMHLIYHDHSNL